MRGRRQFLRQLARIALGAVSGMFARGTRDKAQRSLRRGSSESGADMTVTLFLCGDVMLGRGIDQILAHPSGPVLHESFVRDARRYLALAEAVSGRIPRKVEASYVWGEALKQWRLRRPDARIINLETSITRHDQPWSKGINYRMHPENIAVLTAADIDCCVLANNHVLDWGREGLAETLATLRTARIGVAGAGSRLRAARAPAVLPLAGQGRVLVFAAATEDAGVPESWAAGEARSGVHRLPDLSPATVSRIASDVRKHKRAGDIVVFSAHWGGNWGHAIALKQRAFAHALIDEAGVDLVHGHSSHHPKAVEVHRGHLILYGCGDFLNDYEGIEGHEEFRSELALMYFPRIDAANGHLRDLTLVPTRVHGFRVDRMPDDDRRWLREVLRREYGRMGCGVEEVKDGAFVLNW
ncbi:CapA family protein [Lysobacter sp. CFH 32150]|uniref:CapA family protein n=1 Tax=Lysobacter sp. CFH 32150 TaxID=2927128 RepID=UPI001FA8129F|nr:CapA family protein [Lysobacter sp. CFH 32150]MCI4566659.1 CapA family protein [Lysobacter sp. CFH 32150]